MKTHRKLVWPLILALTGSLVCGFQAAAQQLPSPSAPVLGPQLVPAAALPPEKEPDVNTWYGQLYRLAQAGMSDQVMLSFIDTAGRLELDADRIVALKRQEVSDEVIMAAITHDQYYGVDRVSGTSAPEPAPPIKLAFVKATPKELAAIKPPAIPDPNRLPPGTEPRSIIHQVHEAEPWLQEPELMYFGSSEPVQQEQPAKGTYPVRAPYAVKLTDPIYVFPLPGRAPNLVVLQTF